MKNEAIARTYAEALFELADGQGLLEQVEGEAAFLRKLLREDVRLRAFFESPGIDEADRREVFEAAFRGKVSDAMANFLQLVVHKRRQVHLIEMLEKFQALHDARTGVVHARASTAVPLSAETREALRLKLEANLRKRVVLENIVDEEVLGGVIVRYAGLVADGSLRKALKEMEAPMLETKLGSEIVHEDQS